MSIKLSLVITLLFPIILIDYGFCLNMSLYTNTLE